MKSFKLLSLLMTCLALAACDQTVTVQNGQIPAQYLANASAIVGSYSGYVDSIPNTLTIALNGNYASLSSATDVFGGRCQAHLGELLSFTYNSDNGAPIITGARFALDPNFCRGLVYSDYVDVSFQGTKSFSLNFLNHIDYRNSCYGVADVQTARLDYDHGGPGGGNHGDPDHDGDHDGGWHGNPFPPTPHCYTEAVYVYSYGSFAR